MGLELSSATLHNAIVESGKEPIFQEETAQYYFKHVSTHGEFVVFLRIYEDNDKLQIMTFFPQPVPPKRIEVVGRLLHYLNKEIDMPGFGLDENMNLAYHRIMMLAPEGIIDQSQLETYLHAVPMLCDHFSKAITLAAATDMTFKELTEKQPKKK